MALPSSDAVPVAGAKPALVDVCVCTYRRASLEQTLRSLGAQQGIEGFRIVVADNDETPSAKLLVARMQAELGLDIAYVHAPARNISIARNACLDAVRAPFAAFIDDDEEATPTWLAGLLATRSETDADVVFGPVRAIYPDRVAGWLGRADLHSIRPFLRDGRIEGGYSCNALIRLAALRGLCFDPALGRSGGEDTWFFHQMTMAGAKLVFSPDAFTTEVVGPGRERLAWLLKRSFRAGQTHARILATRGIGRARMAVSSVAKAAYCALCALRPNQVSRNRALVRGALHLGVLSKLAGQRDLTLY